MRIEALKLKINRLRNLLYIFQLSEYDRKFFLNWFKAHPDVSQWLKLEKKSQLKWTFKALLLFFFALLLSLFLKKEKLPYTILAAQKIILPLEKIIIKIITSQAKIKLKKYQNLKIVGIAGSFGKTTAKEYIAHILSQKYQVIKTPENVNTLLGVANFILKTNFSKAHFFIVEIGAYYKGDVQKLCDIIRPQVGVLTGIGQEHLERFESMDNIIQTELEIFRSLPKNGLAVAPLDLARSNLWMSHIHRELDIRELKYFGLDNENGFNIKNLKWGIGECEADIFKTKEFYFKAKLPLVAEHQLNLALAALAIADQFSFNKIEMKLALESLPQIPRRLSFFQTNSKIYILDDSYNATIEGMEAALKVLDRTLKFLRLTRPQELGLRKFQRVVLSAGIPETGAQKKEIHNKLGALYAKYCDLLLLVENSTTSYIIEGINKARPLKDDKNNKDFGATVDIKVFKNAKEAQEALQKNLKPGDIALLQAYDWPDHYY